MGLENKKAGLKFRDNAGFGPLYKLFYKWAYKSERWAKLKLKAGCCADLLTFSSKWVWKIKVRALIKR